MEKKQSITKVITGKCRLAFAHVWEPSRMEETDPLKYSATPLVPKLDKATVQKMMAAQEAAVQEGIRSKWGGKKPANLKLPIRDGDVERPDDEAFAGCYFLNANSKMKPGIIDLNKLEIMDRDEVYSGCTCRFSLTFYPFSGKQNGVAVGLNHIQKVADGPRLGGRSSAENDFDDDFEDDFSDLD